MLQCSKLVTKDENVFMQSRVKGTKIFKCVPYPERTLFIFCFSSSGLRTDLFHFPHLRSVLRTDFFHFLKVCYERSYYVLICFPCTWQWVDQNPCLQVWMNERSAFESNDKLWRKRKLEFIVIAQQRANLDGIPIPIPHSKSNHKNSV